MSLFCCVGALSNNDSASFGSSREGRSAPVRAAEDFADPVIRGGLPDLSRPVAESLGMREPGVTLVLVWIESVLTSSVETKPLCEFRSGEDVWHFAEELNKNCKSKRGSRSLQKA